MAQPDQRCLLHRRQIDQVPNPQGSKLEENLLYRRWNPIWDLYGWKAGMVIAYKKNTG